MLQCLEMCYNYFDIKVLKVLEGESSLGTAFLNSAFDVELLWFLAI